MGRSYGMSAGWNAKGEMPSLNILIAIYLCCFIILFLFFFVRGVL